MQDSKGGAVLMGGGGGGSLFGSTGGSSFLVKLTTLLAVVFSGTCLTLGILSTGGSKSSVDGYIPPLPQTQGATTDTEALKTPAVPAEPTPDANTQKLPEAQ